MIGGIIIAALGLVLLPLPGPGSIVLAVGLMLIASESLTIARLLDWADQKRFDLIGKARRYCKRLGRLSCFLLGACVGACLTAGAWVSWLWLTS